MAKLAEKNVIDYRQGGDTVDDLTQKYIKEMTRVYQFLNNIRTHNSTGTEQVEPEPYQFKAEDDKLYIRNAANDVFFSARSGSCFSGLFVCWCFPLAGDRGKAKTGRFMTNTVLFASVCHNQNSIANRQSPFYIQHCAKTQIVAECLHFLKNFS